MLRNIALGLAAGAAALSLVALVLYVVYTMLQTVLAMFLALLFVSAVAVTGVPVDVPPEVIGG